MIETEDQITIRLSSLKFEPWGLFRESLFGERPIAFIWLTVQDPEITLSSKDLSEEYLSKIIDSCKSGILEVEGIPILNGMKEKITRQKELFKQQAVAYARKEMSDQDWKREKNPAAPITAGLDPILFLNQSVRNIKEQLDKLVKDIGFELSQFIEDCIILEREKKQRKSVLKILTEALKTIAGGVHIANVSNKEELSKIYSRLVTVN